MPKQTPFVLTEPLWYVSRDIDRALGLPETKNYTIVTNSTTKNKHMAAGRQDILWIDTEKMLDTEDLLQKLSEHIPQKSNILVFKNTAQIERLCAKHQWHVLNPQSELSKTVEEKITQIAWLGELASFLPPHTIQTSQDITEQNLPYMVQFNHAHTGEGTLFLESSSQLQDLVKKFPHRPVRVTQYISGMMFTSNNVVTPHAILCGNISYQITGIAPYTNNPFATIGNDWGFAKKILSPKQEKQFHIMVTLIGEKLRSQGWKGLFGVDIMLEEKTGKLFLIEINARQPASTTYETVLQKQAISNERQDNTTTRITTFEAHLMALLDIPMNTMQLISITNGAQLYDRRESEPVARRFASSIVTAHNTLNLPEN